MTSAVAKWGQLLAWAVLPDLLTSVAQRFYYRVRYPAAGTAVAPQPNTPRHKSDRNRIYTLIVVLYLLYSLVNAVVRIPPNFYQILNVPPAKMNPKELRSVFRKLSLQFHPDKTSTGDEMMIFMLRTAYEATHDPVKRFGYELMGPAYERCTRCLTYRDYVISARASLLGSYLGTGVTLVILHFIDKDRFGRYLRFLGTFILAAIEFYLYAHVNAPPANSLLTDLTMTSASPAPTIIQVLRQVGLPYLTLHDFSNILHQLYWALVMGLSSLGPLWFPNEKQEQHTLLRHLHTVTEDLLVEAQTLFHNAFSPFTSPQVQIELRRKMGKAVVESYVMRDPEVGQSYAAARKRASTVTQP
ncbi:hypothetical protein IWQ62_003279 [Dispira parvispora]|uniref:J domain-containing protein n=1 Tax=Dispira parvispora TaxID=1520584 RepID=A0A9W8E1T4_9FUNG|nr:hypothetical protein IWQ62_003279 [Dispira parvispora]